MREDFQYLGVIKTINDNKVEIPVEMMEETGLQEGSNVEVFAANDVIFIRNADDFCELCGGNGKVININDKKLCNDCITTLGIKLEEENK